MPDCQTHRQNSQKNLIFRRAIYGQIVIDIVNVLSFLLPINTKLLLKNTAKLLLIKLQTKLKYITSCNVIKTVLIYIMKLLLQE